jgi:hypothetical protein
MHEIEYNYTPWSFNSTWIKNQLDVGHELRNNNEYVLPAPQIEFFKKIPLYSLPAAWNAAGNLRFYNNITTFKIALKNKLFEDMV